MYEGHNRANHSETYQFQHDWGSGEIPALPAGAPVSSRPVRATQSVLKSQKQAPFPPPKNMYFMTSTFRYFSFGAGKALDLKKSKLTFFFNSLVTWFLLFLFFFKFPSAGIMFHHHLAGGGAY